MTNNVDKDIISDPLFSECKYLTRVRYLHTEKESLIKYFYQH